MGGVPHDLALVPSSPVPSPSSRCVLAAVALTLLRCSLSPLSHSHTHTHTHTRSPKLLRFVFCLLVSCKSGGTGRVSGRITRVHK